MLVLEWGSTYDFLGNFKILNVLGLTNLTLQVVNKLETLYSDLINIFVFALFKEHDGIRIFIYPVELANNINSVDFLLSSLVDLHDFVDLILSQLFFQIDFLQGLTEHSDASGCLHNVINNFMGIIFLTFQVVQLVLEHVFHFVLIIYDIGGQLFLDLLKIMFPL